MKGVLLILVSFLPWTMACQHTWEVDSFAVTFEILNAGFPVTGSYGGLQAQILFDPQQTDKSRIIASIETGTVNTGIRIRDKHLCKPDFFHADAYPRIMMKSRNLHFDKNSGLVSGDFDLNLKGREEMISFPFSFSESENGSATFEGNFHLDRHTFKIGGNSPILGDTVRVHLWVRAKK